MEIHEVTIAGVHLLSGEPMPQQTRYRIVHEETGRIVWEAHRRDEAEALARQWGCDDWTPPRAPLIVDVHGGADGTRHVARDRRSEGLVQVDLADRGVIVLYASGAVAGEVVQTLGVEPADEDGAVELARQIAERLGWL